MSQANISVCMATYNGDRFLNDQINSILLQLGKNDELIISDDSSTDKTIDVIKQFDDPRIRLFENQKFGSPIQNFEFAIKQAQNEYIFLSDQDDIWRCDKVKKCISLLQDYDIVVSDCYIVDSELKILHNSYYKVIGTGKGIMKNMKRNGYLGCCIAFRKECVGLFLPFPKKIPMHDIWIGFVSELFLKTIFYSEQLVYYRRHGNNNSTAGEPSRSSLYQKILNRTNILRYVLIVLIRKLKYKSQTLIIQSK